MRVRGPDRPSPEEPVERAPVAAPAAFGRTGSLGWKVAGGLLAVVLVGAVVAGTWETDERPPRAGQSAVPSPVAAATAGASRGDDRGASPSPPHVVSPSPPPGGTLAAPYADGIPSHLRTDPVYRPADVSRTALAWLPRAFLLGGWHTGQLVCGRTDEEAPPGCRLRDLALAETPGGAEGVDAQLLRVPPGLPPGPYVFHVRRPDADTGERRHALVVGHVVWAGDAHTIAAPLDVRSVLAGLRHVLSVAAFEPFVPFAGCRVAWPSQLYAARTPGTITLVAVFPTPEARQRFYEDAEVAALRAGTGDRLSCLPPDITRTARWFARENIVVVSIGRPAAPDEVEAHLDRAFTWATRWSAAARTHPPLTRPLTLRDTLARLTRAAPAVTSAGAPTPRPSCLVSAAELPLVALQLEGDPRVGTLAVFPSPRDRREYQRARACRVTEAGGGSIWLAHENVILELVDPASETLRVFRSVLRALPEPRVPQ